MCQRNSGAPVVAWVTFNVSSFSWFAEEPGVYASSARGKRYFCSTCGSYLVFMSSELPAEISVNTASFDNPDACPPRKHIFVESRISWFQTADDFPSRQPLRLSDVASSASPAAYVALARSWFCKTGRSRRRLRSISGSVESTPLRSGNKPVSLMRVRSSNPSAGHHCGTSSALRCAGPPETLDLVERGFGP
jgi:hypothetical protein